MMDAGAEGTCRFCAAAGAGVRFVEWVKPTFMDFDKLHEGTVVCRGCAFWLDEASIGLARRMGKARPQRMRNYSHFVVGGEWLPLSKGDKRAMARLLTAGPFPELAVLAVSGQKHIVFRAPRNPPGSWCGWVQLEEQAMFVEPVVLRALLEGVETLYEGFSKREIGSGQYSQRRILDFGVDAWANLERSVAGRRGSPLFDLALFLAQKRERAGDSTT